MPRELAPLPDGTRFMDVVAAAQAAWLACDYVLARDLIQTYVDANGEFCCMGCGAMEHEPWRVNTALGAFFLCPSCTTIQAPDRFVTEMTDSGEIFMEGPKQRSVQTTQFGNGTVVEVKTSQQCITLAKR